MESLKGLSGLERAMAAVDLPLVELKPRRKRVTAVAPFNIANYQMPAGQPFGLWKVNGESFPIVDKQGRPRVHVPCICRCGFEDNIRYHALMSEQAVGCRKCVNKEKKKRREEQLREGAK